MKTNKLIQLLSIFTLFAVITAFSIDSRSDIEKVTPDLIEVIESKTLSTVAATCNTSAGCDYRLGSVCLIYMCDGKVYTFDNKKPRA